MISVTARLKYQNRLQNRYLHETLMYFTGFESVPRVTVTVGPFKDVQEAVEGYRETRGEAGSLIYQTPFDIDLVSYVSFTTKITLNRQPQVVHTHM